jgi:type VI secretion system protein ImpI
MTPLVVAVDDLDTGTTARYAFIKSPIRVGRSELNDLPLPQPYVSGWHGVLQFDDGEVHYVDLGSMNGSSRDGSPLERNVPALLEAGSEIAIGNLRLHFARGAAFGTTLPERAATQFSRHISQIGLVAPEALPAAKEEPVAPMDAAQVEGVEQAIANAAVDLDLMYASYRASWEHLRGAVEQVLVGMDEATRALVLSRLAQKYDSLSQEPQFRSLSGAPEAASVPTGRGAALGFLTAFAQSYLPAPAQVVTAEGAEKLLDRTAEMLEAFGKSYVELRKGYEEFGRQMGVRTVRTDSPIGRARDAQQLLGYLLDLRGDQRSADLQSAFADLMLHQVALLNGVIEGARGLLARLNPDAFSAERGRGVWPLKASANWKAYEARWHEIADEDDGISDALFGTEFARAYSAIMGQRAEEDNGQRKATARPARSTPVPQRRS